MDYECACGCGKLIPYNKTPRERRYFSDACRQRASRKRNRYKHDLKRIIQEADERFHLKLYQDIHRETWQDELEKAQKQRETDSSFILSLLEEKAYLKELVNLLESELAEKEAEIVRLTMLLDGTKKKPR